jgi:outer membrane immunogenic protein
MSKLPKIKMAATSVAALIAAGSTAQAQENWDGFYVGISAGNANGFLGDESTSPDYDIDSGVVIGLFGGHNWAVGSGNTIVGFEVAVQANDISSPDYKLSNVIDLKARLGQSFGQTLVYGFAGYSTGSLLDEDEDVSYTSSGGNFGLGVEYKVNDRFSVGAEVMRRNLDSVGYYGSGEINTASFRASLRF